MRLQRLRKMPRKPLYRQERRQMPRIFIPASFIGRAPPALGVPYQDPPPRLLPQVFPRRSAHLFLLLLPKRVCHNRIKSKKNKLMELKLLRWRHRRRIPVVRRRATSRRFQRQTSSRVSSSRAAKGCSFGDSKGNLS